MQIPMYYWVLLKIFQNAEIVSAIADSSSGRGGGSCWLADCGQSRRGFCDGTAGRAVSPQPPQAHVPIRTSTIRFVHDSSSNNYHRCSRKVSLFLVVMEHSLVFFSFV